MLHEDLPSDVRQLEVHFVADVLHSRQYHIVQAVSGIRALRHNERFEWHSTRAVGRVVLVPDIDGDYRDIEDHHEEE